ncbi:MAG: filamentous hemagglutinin N-terminal domain-containing protein [Pseudomonadota bacterium]
MKNNQSSDNTNIQRGNRMNESGLPRMKPLAAAVGGIVLGGMAMNAYALPSTPEVVSGSVSVTRPDVSTMQINQASNKVILNYQDFGIAAGELVNFVQPGAESVALNRVLGGNPSLILGQLTANGQVFLLNEQGVVFGSGAQVNVGGLVAGTMDIADQNFLDGSYNFSLDGATGSVLNAGNITATEGGYVVLLGSNVANTGVIAARMGSAALLSGENVSLDFGGDGLLSYSVDGGVVDSLVENGGLISADGGLVVMAGQTAGDLQATVVNNEGVVQATGLVERDGKIVLASNATVLNSGAISASSAVGAGGSVSMTGGRVGQLGNISADGATGGGHITLRADEAIALGADSTTTANAGLNGDGGEIIAFTEGEALFRRGASIEARGGADSGDGGFVEVSGLDYVEINGRVDTSAANGASGTFLIDPTDITISGSSATNGMTTVSGTFQSDGSTGTSVILDDDLLALLDTTNVIVTTQTGAEALTAPSGADIIVGFDAVLDASILGNAANNSLTLQAGEDIQVIGTINMDGGELILQAGVRSDIDTGSIITVGLVSAEKITAFADSLITLTNVSANSVDLTINQTGPISVTNDKSLAVTANTASGTGDITVTTTAGDINVESINAGVRTVTLNAAGAIEAAADNAGAEVIAGTLGMTAATGIGAGANSFDISNVNSASAVTSAGNIAIDVIGGTGTLAFTSIDNQGAGGDSVTIDQQGTQALSITTVSTTDGDINITSANANVSVATASAGNNQNVNITTTGSAANVSVGSVTGNVVTITATGAIEELGADGTVDISATQAALSGATGVGAAGAIETSIDTLAATAGGDINLSNTGALDINTVGALTGVSTATAGNITITNDSGITLTEAVTSVGSVTLTASSGNIALAADDGADDITGTTVSLNALLGDVGTVAAPIDIEASVAVNADTSGAAGGDIFIDAGAGGNLPLGYINAGTTTATATLTATGSITDGNTDAANAGDTAGMNIRATNASLTAGDAIGVVTTDIFGSSNGNGNNALETLVTTFDSTVAANLDATINILDFGSPVFTAPIDAGTGVAGSAIISVTGALDATTSVDFADAGDNVGFVATGVISTADNLVVSGDLLLDGADLQDSGADDINSISATRALIASDSAEVFAATTITTLDTSSAGFASSLTYTLNSTALTLADLDGDGTAVNSGHTFAVTANGNITINNAVTAGGDVTIDGNTNVLDVNANVTAAGTLTLTDTSDLQLAGGVVIDAQAGNAELDTGVTTTTLDGTGTVTVQTTLVDADVNLGTVTAAGTQGLTVSATNAANLNGTLTLGGGDLSVSVDSNDNAATTLTVTNAISGVGNVLLSGGATANDVIDVNQSVTAAGGITVQNASDVQLDGGSTIEAQGGNVDINNNVTQVSLVGVAGTAVIQTTTADNDVELGPLVSAGDNLTIISTNQATLDTINMGGGDLDVTVDSNDNGAVTLAVQNISNVGNVTLTGSGLAGSDIIDVNQSITAAGFITIEEAQEVQILGGATLEAQGGAVDISTNIGGITLDGSVGTVVVTTTTAGADNNVSLANLTSNGDGLTVTSEGNAILGTLAMGGGNLDVQIDSDNDNPGLTLLIDDAITNAGNILLHGDGVSFNEIIDINQSITAGGSLAINDAATVDIAGNLALEGAGVDIQANITAINLSGADGELVTITSTGDANTINTAAVTAGANVNLTMVSDGGLTLAGTIDINDGAFSATVDADDDGAGTDTLLVSQAPSAGSITLSGGGTGTGDVIDVNADLTSTAGGITIRNASDVQLDASAARTLTATGGDIDISQSVAVITLDNGASTVTLDANTDTDVLLAALVDDGTGGTAADLVINAEGSVTLATVDLNDAVQGDITVNIDNNANGTESLTLNGNIQNVAIAAFNGASGGTPDEIFNVNAGITASGALSFTDAATVNLAGDIVLQGVNVDIEDGGGNGITGVNLTGGAATTVQIISTGDGNTVSLAPVTASSNGSLTLQSDGNLAINGAINLGTGTLNAQVDTDTDTDQTLTVAATVTAGTVTLAGGSDGANDTIDVNANVTAATGALTIQDALAVDLAANVALQGDSVSAVTQVGAVNLSGAGTNTVTSTTGDVTLGAITDSAAANLTISSAANATLSTVTLDFGGAGTLLVTADANDDTAGATLTLGGAVNVTGAATLSGGITVDDLIDINDNVTAGGALTLQNAAADLAGGFNLTGLSVAADTATNALSGINLSGAGTNTITGTGGDVSLAPVTDSADASLVVTATGNTTLDAITLDDGAASTATLSADSDDNSASTLTLNGVVSVDGAVSLAGSATADDAIDVNANVTAGGALTATNAATLDLAGNVNLTGASVTANAGGGVALINLSGAGTNTITATAGDVDVTAIGDTGDANLVISATGNVTTAVITLDDAGATGGAVTITADDDDNTAAATLLSAGAITADGAVTLAGGSDNDDTIDINANITAGGALTISNGAADLAAAIALQGASVAAVTDLTINLSGVGTNTITSTTGDVTLGAVTDSAVANLTVSSAANATLAAITLDDGAGVLSVTADDDDNTAGAVLAANGAIAVGGTATLSGGTDNNDLLDINANVTAGGALTLQNGTADLAAGVNLTGASVAADTTTNQLAGIDLSGAGTNTITSTTGDTSLAPVTDSADASLVVSSEGNVTLASVVLDDAGATNGTVTVTADSGDDTVGAILTTNGMVMADGAVAFSGGATVDDLMDINGNVTSGAALTLSNTAGIDLAANINLTGASVTADGTTNAAGINLSGAGTNTVTATAGDVGLAPIADTADASLVVSATGNVTLAAITLDDAGSTNGAVTVTADDDDNTAAATLTLNGVVDADGAVTLAGGTDNDDIIDVNQNITTDSALVMTNAANVDVAAAAVLLQGASVSITTGITEITLSGAATYAITSTGGDINLAPVVDTAAANLNISSEANTTLAGIVFDDGGAGVLNVTTDDNDNTAGATLAVNGVINVNGAATFLGGTDTDDTIDVNADITSAAALTLNSAGTLDLAGGVTITGAGVEAQTGVTSILLSGAAGTTVTVVSTGDANTMVLAPVSVSDNGNLTLLSEGDITLAGGIDLGTGALNAQVDTDTDTDQTLTVSTAVSAGTVTLAGGSDGANDTIDVNANVTATTGALTIQDALAVDLAGNIALQGVSVSAATQVGAINLSGFGINTITSTTGDVTLGAITDSAAANLTISSAANATLSTVTLDFGGAGTLLVTADANDDTAGATLTLGGAVNVTGAATLSGGITVDDLIDINDNVTAGGALTLQNAAADLAGGFNLTGLSVAADTATNALSGINLSGAGTNTITGTGGDVSLAPVTDSADASLVVTATGNTTLDAITLDDGAASTATLSADSDDNSASTLTLNGVVSVDGAVSLAGSATADDAIDVNANVTAGGALTATNAATLDLAGNVNLTGASVTANAGGGVALINLSGAGTNTITATAGDVDVTAIGDTGDANLVISATGNVTTAVITLDDAGATGGAVTITADDDDNTAAATLLSAGAITADGAVTLAGGSDNDDTIDINANITAGGALTISNGAADLAAAIALQGASVAAVTDLTINLSGVGTNTITSTTGDVTLGAVTDSAVANLTVSSAANATLAAITLDDGAGVLSVTADDDDNTAGAVLAANGAIAVGGTATLSGGTDNNDLLDINANVTAGGALTLQNGTADLAAGVNLTGASVAADTTTNQLAGIDLSGAGTNTITSTTGDTSLAPVTDSADASLVVSSEGNVTLASVVLDDAGATNGTVTVTADSGDDTVGAILTTNGMVMADGAVAFSGGATVDDLMDINGNVTSGAALTLSNTAGIDLAANINLTGASVTADGTTNAAGINLSGAGTNTVTATAGDVGLAPIADTADASLVVSATGNVTLAAITLDDAGSTNGAVTVTADDDDNTAAATLTLNGVVDADGAVTLAGGTDNDDIIDVNQNITTDSALVMTNAANVDVAAAAVLLQGASVNIWSDVATITLSGAATNVVTSTAGNVNLSPVVDTAAANLTINSTADVILAGVVLDFGGAGALTVNLDTDADGANLLDANGDITANTITVTGTAASGTETVSLAGDVDLTATTGGISLAAADNIGEITLDGAGTNIVTATGDGDISLAAVTDTAAANLTINGEGNVTLAGITLDAGGAGVVTVTGDSDSDGVTTLAVNGAIGATGAITLSTGDANDTIDVNAGITSTGGSVTISNSADVRVTNVTIDAQGGDLSVDGGITLDAGAAGTAVLQTSVADNDVTVAVINNTAGEGVTISSTGGATLGGAINLTNGGNGDLTVAVDSDDDAGVMETLAINNTVNAGDVVLTAGNVNSMSNITQAAVITADTLTATATNGITLTQNNVVPIVSLTNRNGGNVAYNSDLAGPAVPLTISGSNSFATGTFTAVEATQGMTVAAAGVTTNGGAITLTTTAAAQLLTSAGVIQSNQTTATGANITLTADDMAIGAAVNAGTVGTVTLAQVTTTDAIDLGALTDATANSLDLSSAELTLITAPRLLIGSPTAGTITVSADVSILNVTTTHLTNNNTVTGTAGGIIAHDVAISAGGTVNITDTDSNIDNLAVAAAGFDVTFTNEVDGFEVDTVDGVTGITGANVTLSTGGNLQMVRGITATANIAATAAGNIIQDAGIAVTTSAGSVTYSADADDNGSGAITMGIDATIETGGTAGENISLTAGTAAGGQDITLANVDAGADGNVTVQTFAGAIRDDDRDSSVITGDNITLTANGDIGSAAKLTVEGNKSAALEITTVGLTGISATSATGNVMLMAVDSANFDPETFLTGLAGTGMSAGTEDQIFIGALDGAITVNTAIDLTGPNNDLMLFTGGEGRDITINTGIALNRDPLDTTQQRLLKLQASGNITHTDSSAAGRLVAYEVEASAPNGSITLFTGTDLLEGVGGVDENIEITNDTPVNSRFTDSNGNPTTRLLEEIVTAGTGSITIVNNGSLTIDKNVKTTGTGDISITANSPLFIESQVSAGGAVDLISGGDADVDGVYIINGGTVQSNSVSGAADGSIEVTAANKIVLDATAVLSTLAAGNNGLITLTADSNTDVSGTGAGEVTMASGARLTSAGGAPITVTAGGGIALAELNAGLVAAADVVVNARGGAVTDANAGAINIVGNDVTLTAGAGGIDTDLTASGVLTATSSAANGDININAQFGGISLATADAGTGNVTLVAENGGISDSNGAGTNNITGSTVTLNADGAINTDVEAATSLSAIVQNAAAVAQNGAITLRSTGNMALGSVGAGTGPVSLTAGGAISDTNGATVNIVAGPVSMTANGGGIDTDVDATDLVNATSTSAGGAIDLANTTGNLALGTVGSNGGAITLTAATGNMTANAITSTGGDISATSSAGSLDLDGVDAGAGNVTLTAATTLAGTVAGNLLTATAGGNIGSGSASLNTTVATLNATSTGGGIWVSETDGLDVQTLSSAGMIDLTAGGDLSVVPATGAGAASIVTTGGNLTLGGLTTTGAVTLASTGTLAATNLVTAAGATVSVTGGGDTTLSTVTGGTTTVTSGGTLDTSGGALTVAGVSLTSAGDMTLGGVTSTAGVSATSGGFLAATDAAGVTAAAGITATAATTLTASSLTAGDTVNLTGTNGAVSVTDLTAVGTVDISALSGTLAVTNATTGATAAVNLSATGATTVSTLTGGAVTATSGGTLDVTSMTAGGTTRLTSGDTLTVTTLAAGTNQVALVSATGAVLSGFTSGETTLDSNGGTVSVTNLAATGPVVLDGTGDMTLTTLSSTAGLSATTTGGALSATGLTAAGDITGTAATSLTAATLSGGGNVTLTGNSGAVSVDGLTTTGAVDLTAASGTLAASNITTGAGASVDVSASGATTLATVTGGATTVTSGGTLGVTSLTAGGATRLTSAGELTVTTFAGGSNPLTMESGAGATLSGITAGETSLDSNGGTVAASNINTGTATLSMDAVGNTTLTTATAGATTVTSGGTLGVTSLTAAGATRLTSAGELTATTVNAGNNSLTVSSGAGATLTGLVGGETQLDSDGALVLTTLTSGATTVMSGGTLVTTGGTLTTGALGLTSAGDMTVGAVTSSGAITANSGGAFDASNAASVTAATDITATAATTLVATNLDAGGRVTLTGSNGNMTVTDVTTTGAVSLTAEAGTLTASSLVTGAGSAVSVSASGNTLLNTVTGGATTVMSGGTLGVTSLTAGGNSSLTSEGDMTLAMVDVTGSLSIDTNGALTTDDVAATGAIVAVVDGILTVSGLRGSDTVTLALGEDLIDTNTSGTPSITGTTLTITGGKAVIGLDTAVTGLDLDTAATSIANTGTLNVTDSTVTGDLRLTSTGSITLGNINVAGQDVFLLSSTGQILDGNGDALNITAAGLDLVAGAVNGLETAVSSLRVLASSIVTISNSGALTVTQAATSGLLTLDNDGALTLALVEAGTADITAPDIAVGNLVADNTVILNASGRITDTNGSAENIRAAALEISGGASVDGLETRVDSLSLVTGDTTISNLFELVLQDSVVSGDLNLTNVNTLTFGELFVDGNADINVLSGNVVLGHAQLTGTLSIFADGSLLDGNGSAVNITSVMGTALSGGGVVGTIADPLEVVVGGDLSLAPTGAAGYVSAHINGSINGFTLIDQAVPGFVIQNAQAIGGGNYRLVAAPLAGELRLLDGGMGFEYNFMFEGIGDSLYPTDSVGAEIRYGTEGAADILDIEDILSMPMTSVDFDKWLDRKVEEAIVKLAVR